MTKPTLKEERKLWLQGTRLVAGLDEVGRGPLAGPVVAAAVAVLPLQRRSPRLSLGLPRLSLGALAEVRDSKQLSSKRREHLERILIRHPQITWGLGRASERVINRIGMQRAWQFAMRRAVHALERKLGTPLDCLIVDGLTLLNLPHRQLAIVKADQLVFSCAAASIIAKVRRDRLMRAYHKQYPQYGFDRHKGYGTALHREAIRVHGLCRIHRTSFAKGFAAR